MLRHECTNAADRQNIGQHLNGFNRSAARFRQAPAFSLGRTHGTHFTPQWLRHSRGLYCSRGAKAVSRETLRGSFRRHSRRYFGASKLSSQVRNSVAPRQVLKWREMGSSDAGSERVFAERRGLGLNMAQPLRMGAGGGFSRDRVAFFERTSQQSDRLSGRRPDPAAAFYRSSPARCRAQDVRVPQT